MGPPRSKQNRPSVAEMPGNVNLSPIACEACRQRKCKCDRKLPFCSHCSSEPSKCAYPESGKRGLPLGYMNQLEQRLAETETALYGALVTLRSTRPTTVVQATAKPNSVQKPKAARMDEWSRLPLRDWSDMGRWQAAMGDQFVMEQPQRVPFTDSTGAGYSIPISRAVNDTHSPQEEAQASPAIYDWQPREDVHMGSPYETRLRPPGMVSSPLYSGCQAAGSEGVTSPTDGLPEYANVTGTEDGLRDIRQSIMADELSKSKPSIYF